jgi:hypothetical protein
MRDEEPISSENSWCDKLSIEVGFNFLARLFGLGYFVLDNFTVMVRNILQILRKSPFLELGCVP